MRWKEGNEEMCLLVENDPVISVPASGTWGACLSGAGRAQHGCAESVRLCVCANGFVLLSAGFIEAALCAWLFFQLRKGPALEREQRKVRLWLPAWILEMGFWE